MNNFVGLILATLYVFAVIGVAEALRKWAGWGSDMTRKVVHIGVGMLMWLIPFIFDNSLFFIVTALAFSVVTLVDNRYHFFPAMASKDDSSNLGTFYFPLVAALSAWLFWDEPALMVAAMMPLVWGDGMAEIIGRKYGNHPFSVFGHTRSYEGSAAFFICGWLATWLALFIFPSSFALTAATALVPALVIVGITMFVEAVSVAGLDNITITVVAILILSFWPF